MHDPIVVALEDLLASTADLVSVLTHFADSSRRRSAQHRSDRQFVQSALSALLPTISTGGPLPPSPPVVAPDASVSSPQRNAPTKATLTSGRRHAVHVRDAISRVQRRQYCQCGQCKWCLDNTRWNRIFDEKFADPTYYGGIVLRHNSTLAEAR